MPEEPNARAKHGQVRQHSLAIWDQMSHFFLEKNERKIGNKSMGTVTLVLVTSVA